MLLFSVSRGFRVYTLHTDVESPNHTRYLNASKNYPTEYIDIP